MPTHPRLLALLAAPLVLVLASCSGEGCPPLHPVRGAATYRNKPAARAVVVLRPVAPGPLKNTLPHGEVGPDGAFRVGTYEAGDGAPAGEYVVTVTWPETRTDPAGDPVTTDRLRGRFADPARGAWKVTIREGDNELGPFRLD